MGIQKQKLVSLSSMKSKFIAGAFTLSEWIWLNKLLANGFHIKFTLIPIFTDNQSAITYSKNEINNRWMKCINIHYHYSIKQIIPRNIKIVYIKTAENPANVLMKPLSLCKHLCILELLGIHQVWGGVLSIHLKFFLYSFITIVHRFDCLQHATQVSRAYTHIPLLSLSNITADSTLSLTILSLKILQRPCLWLQGRAETT